MRSVFKKLSALLLISALIFSFASCSLTDDHEPEETTTELTTLSSLPQGNDGILDYFNRVLAVADEGTPSFNIKTSIDAFDFESENGLVKSAFPTIKKYMLRSDTEAVEFGTKFTQKLPGEKGLTAIDPANVKSVEATWPDVESGMTTVKANEYVITIEFNDALDAQDVLRYFGMTDKGEVLTEFEKASDYVQVNDYSSEYTGCRLEVKVDIHSDRIVWLAVTRAAVVTASATCTGKLASAGDVTASFKFTKTYEFKDFDWTAPKK